MFERTIEAQALGAPGHHGVTVSFAILAHLAMFLAIAIVTALNVPPITEPPIPFIFTPPMVIDLGLDRKPPTQKQAAPAPLRGDDGRHTPKPTPPTPPAPTQPPQETPSTLPPPAQPQGDAGPPGVPGETDGSDQGIPGATGKGGGGDDPDAEGGGGVRELTAEIVRPVLVLKIDPIYPEVARIARLQGKVNVQAVIGLDGSVESAEILSSTNPLFNDAALAAVRQWKYRPATMDGRPVRVYFGVAVTFVIR